MSLHGAEYDPMGASKCPISILQPSASSSIASFSNSSNGDVSDCQHNLHHHHQHQILHTQNHTALYQLTSKPGEQQSNFLGQLEAAGINTKQNQKPQSVTNKSSSSSPLSTKSSSSLSSSSTCYNMALSNNKLTMIENNSMPITSINSNIDTKSSNCGTSTSNSSNNNSYSASSSSSTSSTGSGSSKPSYLNDNDRPPHSYIALISMAILSKLDRKILLNEIYDWVVQNFPYYQSRTDKSWRNSIRHNLSLNECFVKVGKASNGRGYYWSIHSANLSDFKKGDFRRRQARLRAKHDRLTSSSANTNDGTTVLKISKVQTAKSEITTTNSKGTINGAISELLLNGNKTNCQNTTNQLISNHELSSYVQMDQRNNGSNSSSTSLSSNFITNRYVGGFNNFYKTATQNRNGYDSDRSSGNKNNFVNGIIRENINNDNIANVSKIPINNHPSYNLQHQIHQNHSHSQENSNQNCNFNYSDHGQFMGNNSVLQSNHHHNLQSNHGQGANQSSYFNGFSNTVDTFDTIKNINDIKISSTYDIMINSCTDSFSSPSAIFSKVEPASLTISSSSNYSHPNLISTSTPVFGNCSKYLKICCYINKMPKVVAN